MRDIIDRLSKLVVSKPVEEEIEEQEELDEDEDGEDDLTEDEDGDRELVRDGIIEGFYRPDWGETKHIKVEDWPGRVAITKGEKGFSAWLLTRDGKQWAPVSIPKDVLGFTEAEERVKAVIQEVKQKGMG